MQYSNYLAQIAALIKQNPSITVREIASELKFADSKSVYYWLEKGNVGGINEFKRLVLSQDQPHPSSFSFSVDGVAHYLVLLPLHTWNPKQKTPKEGWYYLHNHPQPRGLFAVRVGTDKYAPWFVSGDILVIDESVSHAANDWVLLKSRQEYLIGKAIGQAIVDPNTLKDHPASAIVVGTIVSQERNLKD